MGIKTQNPHPNNPKKNRRIQSDEFKKIISTGKKITSRYLTFFLLPNTSLTSRFGFAVPKRLGKAVQRNRMRRILKECVRNQKLLYSHSVDGVWMVKENFLNSNKDYIYQQFDVFFDRVIQRKFTVC